MCAARKVLSRRAAAGYPDDGEQLNWRSIAKRRGNIRMQARAPGTIASSQRSHWQSCATQNQVHKPGMLQIASGALGWLRQTSHRIFAAVIR